MAGNPPTHYGVMVQDPQGLTHAFDLLDFPRLSVQRAHPDIVIDLLQSGCKLGSFVISAKKGEGLLGSEHEKGSLCAAIRTLKLQYCGKGAEPRAQGILG